MKQALVAVVAGTLFGWILARGGLTDYDVMMGLFRLDNLHVAGVMGIGIGLSAVGLFALRRTQPTPPLGERIAIAPKPWPRGLIPAGLLFGTGWALTGACPGPAFTQLGEGKLGALATVGGMLLGTWLYGVRQRTTAVAAVTPTRTAAERQPVAGHA